MTKGKTKEIAYVGTSDIRELNSFDLPEGVEEGLSFRRGKPQEVSAEVADHILAHPSLQGEFREHVFESRFADMTAKELEAEIDSRNEHFSGDQQISKEGNKADLQKRLDALEPEPYVEPESESAGEGSLGGTGSLKSGGSSPS